MIEFKVKDKVKDLLTGNVGEVVHIIPSGIIHPVCVVFGDDEENFYTLNGIENKFTHVVRSLYHLDEDITINVSAIYEYIYLITHQDGSYSLSEYYSSDTEFLIDYTDQTLESYKKIKESRSLINSREEN